MNPTCRNCDRPTGDNSLLCATCGNALVADLRSVPGLVDDMTITQARLDKMSRGRLGGKSAETSLPIRLDKHDQRPTERPLDALATSITTWARDLAEHMGIDSGTLGGALDSPGLRELTLNHRSGRSVDHAALSMTGTTEIQFAAVWLVCHASYLRRHPAIDELFCDVTDVVTAARRAVDRLPELSYKGTCGYITTDGRSERVCGADIYVERGDQYARCPLCRSHYSVRDLDLKMLNMMHEMNYTAGELTTLLTELGHRLPQNTIRVWAHRQELRARGWKRNGQITDHWIHRNDPPVYRLGDVLALVEKRRNGR